MLKQGIFGGHHDFPSEDVLKTIATHALGLSDTEFDLGSLENISTKSHPKFKENIVIEYLVKLAGSSNDTFPVSILMKKCDLSTSTTELQAYSTFFKDLQPNVKVNSFAHNGNLYNFIPRPYLSQKPYLFLENLESFGYKQASESLNLDFGHCLLVVEAMAKFHATSYFFRRQLGEKGKGKLEMMQKYPFLSQSSSMYSPKESSKFAPIYEKSFELASKVIESENPSLAFKLRRKIDPANVFDKVVKLLEEEKYENDDFYVVCHGDMHAENVLFSYKNNEPKQCRITNLQSLFYGPLASDLATFLLVNTSFKFRVEYEEKLVAFYCDAFEEQLISRYNNNPVPDFDIEEFHRKLEKQYRKMLEFAFYNACFLIPVLAFNKNNSQRNNQTFSYSSMSHLARDNVADELFSEKDSELPNFVMNNKFVKERLVELLKQLTKCRVLL